MTTLSQGIQFLPFSADLVGMVLLLVVLLICSALTSCSETSFFSLSPGDIKALEEQPESKSSRAALELLENEDRLLSSLLIFNNLVNIAAILAANGILDQLIDFGDAQVLHFVVNVIIVTFILLLFGEIMPKVFATSNALAVVKKAARPLRTVCRILNPLSFVLMRGGSFITRTLSKKQANLSMSELTDAIEITETDSDEDKRMLTGIVRFVKTEVDQIMKPRIDVVALSLDSDFEAVKQTVIDSGFSRIPVYGENLDDIRGVLYVKDLLPHLTEQAGFAWQKLLRPTYFVPEHKKINDLLEDFQGRKIHFAVVVDEYGGTLGIVSLEDILEEIVGEIADESDTEQVPIFEPLSEGRYLFEGRVHLGDFLRALELPDDLLDRVRGDADTLAGLMLEIRGEFFEEGDAVNFDNIEFKARRVENRRITKVEVTVESADVAEAE